MLHTCDHLHLAVFGQIFVLVTSLVGCFGVPRCMKQQEIRRNKENKTRNGEKEIKNGDFLRFWPSLGPPIEVTGIFVHLFLPCVCV